jgi:hypothetical protein
VRKAHAYIPSTPLGLKEKAFLGETFYTADNPPFGAVFTYYLKEEIRSARSARWAAEKEAAKKGAPPPPYPTDEALRAEAREEEPAVLITVKDADGNVVRRLSGPTKAGIHRVAWDLRFPASAPTPSKPYPSAVENPFFDRPQGPLAVPGAYTVSFEKRADGVLSPLAPAQAFSVEALGLQTLKAKDAAELLAFQKRTARLQRAVLGAVEAAQAAQKQLDLVKKALDDTPAAAPKLGEDARRIERGLDEVLVALKGDEALRERNIPTPLSISERLEAIVSSHWSATVAPTGTNRAGYELAAAAFDKELARLRGLVETDLAVLQKAMEAAGSPWTPGRVPIWSKE